MIRRSDPAAVRAWRERGARAHAAKRQARLRNQQTAEKAASTKGRQKAAWVRTRLARKTRLSPISKDRKKVARRFERAFLSREYVGFICSLDCCVPGCGRRPVDPAHVGKPRSRGGRWFEIAPLCRSHHREQEKRTAWFNAKHGIDLEAIASALAFDHLAFLAEREPRRTTAPRSRAPDAPASP